MTTRMFSQLFMTMSAVVLVIISGAIETDIFVPSFPTIQAHFGTTESLVQMIIGINFLGLCLGSLFYGPLCDSYGRRSILLIGMLLFAASSIACLFANSMTSLLFWRFIQGLGSSVAFVVPAAIIYDVYDQEKAAKMLGIYNSIVTFAMSLAPMIGSYLYITFHWRANFIFVAALALITLIFAFCFIKETLDESKRVKLHLGTILQGFKQLLLHPVAMANLYLICVVCGAYFAYITNLSLIFINHLGLDNDVYAYYQAIILFTFALVSFFSGHIIMRFGIAKMRMLGIKITGAGGILMLGVALFAPYSAILITATMTLFTAGFALCVGILFGDYMNVFPEIKGLASSLANSIRLFAMSLLIAIAGMTFNGTIMPVAIIVFLAGISALGVIYWLHKQT